MEPNTNAPSYAKYLTMPMTPPPEELVRLFQGPAMDPALADDIHHFQNIISPDPLPCENGFCVMPDGSGYAAVETKMPEVTPEMIDWWFVWHSQEPLRYQIWNPKDHRDIQILPSTLPRRLDRTLSLRERNWDTVDLVTENIGGGDVDICIHFLSPMDFGYDMAAAERAGVLTIVSSNGFAKPVGAPMDQARPTMTSTGTYRPLPGGGVVLRSRFYFGWTIQDKKPVRVDLPVDEETMRGMANHCLFEYHHLARLLPQVYRENFRADE